LRRELRCPKALRSRDDDRGSGIEWSKASHATHTVVRTCEYPERRVRRQRARYQPSFGLGSCAIVLSVTGLMRSMAMPSLSHHTESFEILNRALGLAKGTPLSERMASGSPCSRNSRSKAVMAGSSRVESSASQSSRKREAWS